MRHTNKRKSSSKNNDVLDLTNDDNTVAESVAKAARTGDVKAEDDLAASALAGLAASNKRPAPPVFPIPFIQDSNPQASDTVSTPKKKKAVKSVSSSNVSKASKPVPAVQQTVVPRIIEQAQLVLSSAVASTSANPVMPQPPVLQLIREHLGRQLLDAAAKGNVNSIKALLYTDQTLINFANKNGFTALHSASHFGHLEIVKELLSRNPASLTGVGKLNGQELNAFDVAVKFCRDANKKAAVLKFLFDNNPEFFAASAKKLDAEYRKQIGMVLPSELAQPVAVSNSVIDAPIDASKAPPPPPMPKSASLNEVLDIPFVASVQPVIAVQPQQAAVSTPAPVQNVSLVDRTNALRDAVVNAAQTEFSMNVNLQRAMNASGVASTLSGVQKFLAETSIIYLPKVVDFAAKGSLTDKVENTEIVFKAMMNEINRNITDPALSGYLSRI